MKKGLLGLMVLAVLAAGCSKGTDKDCGKVKIAAAPTEIVSLQSYLNSKSITATGDSLGFFYNIANPGNTKHPTVCNGIRVNYQGFLTNGSQFDAGNNVRFQLDNLIIGWKEALPLIGEGGTITLYLPPSLGYGAIENGNVPANSITIFQIDLLEVL